MEPKDNTQRNPLISHVADLLLAECERRTVEQGPAPESSTKRLKEALARLLGEGLQSTGDDEPTDKDQRR